jgi:hypothetical protein
MQKMIIGKKNHLHLIDIVDEYIVIIDDDGKMIEINEAFRTLISHRYSQDYLTLYAYIESDSLSILKNTLSMLSDGSITKVETRLKEADAPDCSIFWTIKYDYQNGLYYMAGRDVIYAEDKNA